MTDLGWRSTVSCHDKQTHKEEGEGSVANERRLTDCFSRSPNPRPASAQFLVNLSACLWRSRVRRSRRGASGAAIDWRGLAPCKSKNCAGLPRRAGTPKRDRAVAVLT